MVENGQVWEIFWLENLENGQTDMFGVQEFSLEENIKSDDISYSTEISRLEFESLGYFLQYHPVEENIWEIEQISPIRIKNLSFNKKNEFVIYVGSHGDNGAELADIILPGAAYTEQSGHYTNLEGRVQKAYKASYPPGDAKEDWEIINDLAEFMNNRKLFNDKDELESSMFNYLNLKKEKQENLSNTKVDLINFEDEILKITYKDYYFSNVIARSSKTMLNCNNSKLEVKRTGTEG